MLFAPSATLIIDLTSAAVSSFGTAFPLSLPTILLLVIVSSFDKDIAAFDAICELLKLPTEKSKVPSPS